MKLLLTTVGVLTTAGALLLSAFATPTNAAPKPAVTDTAAPCPEPETITVQIQTRGAPNDPITFTDGPKERCFRLYCAECYFHPIISICVEFESGISALELAKRFEQKVKDAIRDSDCLEFCDYKVELANDALIITGCGAGKYAGTDLAPEYEGETGDDFDAYGNPKKSPLCRLAIYKS